jgi:amidase
MKTTKPSNPVSALRRWACVVGCSMLATFAASAATFDLTTATVADVNAAFNAGALTAEKLTSLYLARIKAYNDAGPNIHAVVFLNPKALDDAKALDAERKAKGPRSPLHGIPVLLKDNFHAKDMPATGGAFILAGSTSDADGFAVAKLRAAGAIILGKVNMSEWLNVYGYGRPNGRDGFSTGGGQTRNPHNLDHGPAGSSGGTGAAIAANFALIGFGSDTGGSIRGPSAANGIVGLKPTNGLISRSGILPLSMSMDTAGPMTRSVYDLAVTLGPVTGIDSTDALTTTQAGLAYSDYTRFLDKNALKGARIGVFRGVLGRSAETDRVFEASLADLKAAGATLVDSVQMPDLVMDSYYNLWYFIVYCDLRADFDRYLSHLKPGYPKNMDELVRLSRAGVDAKAKTDPAFKSIAPLDQAPPLTRGVPQNDPRYIAATTYGMPMIKNGLLGVFAQHKLDAIVYPTSPRPAKTILPPPTPLPVMKGDSFGFASSLAGFPEISVPAGTTSDKLPVNLSFLGSSYSEPALLAYAYAYEQATHRRVNPSTTPALPGEKFDY